VSGASIASGAVVRIASGQQGGITRTDFRRHDLIVPGWVGVISNKKLAGTPIAEHFAASESSELK